MRPVHRGLIPLLLALAVSTAGPSASAASLNLTGSVREANVPVDQSELQNIDGLAVLMALLVLLPSPSSDDPSASFLFAPATGSGTVEVNPEWTLAVDSVFVDATGELSPDFAGAVLVEGVVTGGPGSDPGATFTLGLTTDDPAIAEDARSALLAGVFPDPFAPGPESGLQLSLRFGGAAGEVVVDNLALVPLPPALASMLLALVALVPAARRGRPGR